jgi:hypothetical protein
MKKTLLLLFFALSSLIGSATHLKGGYVSIRRSTPFSAVCTITVTVFTDTDCSDCVLFGGDLDKLDFGDGTFVTVPTTQNGTLPGFQGVGIASFTIQHTFPSNSRYVISYSEPNRNAGVRNMVNSVGTLFYVETMIDLSVEGFRSTPNFLIAPIFQAKLGSNLSLSAGASSEDGFSLLYQFGTPSIDHFSPVENYRLPENISINPFTGIITWDTKFEGQYQTGEYAFTIVVSLFKEIDGEFYKVCSVSRDIQIILEDTSSDLISSMNTMLDENGRIYIPTNETKTVKIFFEKINTTSTVELSAVSELQSNSGALSFIEYDSSTAPNIKVGVLTLTALPEIDNEKPYLIIVRGQFDDFGKDVSFLFFTRDVQPKLTEYVELITETDENIELIEAYPNPTTGVFTISLPGNQKAMISVRDQAGKLMQTLTTNGTTSLDLRYADSGFYYCTILSGSKIRVIKVVKN